MCRLANARGGVCLSKDFIDNKTKLHWRCAEGHEWRATPQNVIRGHWCMICGNKRQGRAKAHTIEMMNIAAAAKGGVCLSQSYQNNLTKLRWRCKRGHEWEAVPSSIVGSGDHKGSWCPFCAGKLPKKLALQELKKLAASHGGKLLSARYQDARSHLRWRCEKGHEWKAVPHAVKRGGWCPVCGGSYPLNLAIMRKAARSFGGRCLSKEYVNSKSHIHWRCAEGHEWKAKPDHVLKGHWCPICSSGVSERICRALLEKMTGVQFMKARPKWLRNERDGQMELDGFAPSLGLAFEYHGHQHYQLVPFFHANPEEFSQRQEDDKLRRQLCRENGITLLEVPHYIPHDKLQEYLAKKLDSLKRGLIRDHTPVKIRQLGVWLRKNLEEMQSIAAARGGKLLSKFYINSVTKLRWRCAEGHTWEAIPNSIKRGGWCRKCGFKRSAIKRAHTIDEMRALAKAKGGQCLSLAYRNSKDRLRWRCAKGHEWEAQVNHVNAGHWCPRCGHEKLARLYALSIEDMKAAAERRGGMCLSEKYENQRSRLRWRCAHGHEWEALAMSIRRGSWCPICVGKRPVSLPAG